MGQQIRRARRSARRLQISDVARPHYRPLKSERYSLDDLKETASRKASN